MLCTDDASPHQAETGDFFPGCRPYRTSLESCCRYREGSPRENAFTILEMLVALVITSLIITLLLAVMQSTAETWRRNTERSKSFSAARAAFESISRALSTATLNTYEDYYDIDRKTRTSGDLNFRPNVYGRRSDLHFITGTALVTGQAGGGIFFTAPLDYDTNTALPATGGQLNGIGYFVRFSTDTSLPAFITNNPPRYRLFQFLQPTSNLKVMNSNFPGNTWFTSDVNASMNCYPLADNIVAFAILPKLSDRENTNLNSLTTNFSYDTRMPWTGGPQPNHMHQLPPLVRVVMVALDESSAARSQGGSSDLGYDPSTIFDKTKDLETSLDTITSKLSEKRLNFCIFRADIPIRAAKWSAD